MKKKYTINLTIERTDELKRWLKNSGISFSGYFDALVASQLDALKRLSPDGDATKMTTSELLKMAEKMVEELKK